MSEELRHALRSVSTLIETKEKIVFGLKWARNRAAKEKWTLDDARILKEETALLYDLFAEERQYKIEAGIFNPLGLCPA